MAIKVIKMPRRAEEVLDQALVTMLTSGHLDVGRTFRAREQSLALPHEVYQMGLDEASEGRVPRQPMSLRLIMFDGEKAKAAVELDPAGRGVRQVMMESSYVEDTVRQLGTAMKRKTIDAQGRDYELRMLRVPALYVNALWLHNEASKEEATEGDFVIPVKPAFEPFAAGRVYTFPRFIELIQEQAKALRQAYSEDEDQKGG